MSLSIPFKLNEEVFPLFATLLQNKISDVRLEIDLSKLGSEEEEEALKKQLKALNIEFKLASETSVETTESDDEDQPNPGKYSLSCEPKIQVEETITKEITDYYLVQFFNFRKRKQDLSKQIERLQLTIDITPQKITFSGAKSKVEELSREFSKISYIKSIASSIIHSKCLKQLKYIKDLEKKYESDFRSLKEMGTSRYRIIIFGKDQNKMEEFKKKLEEASEKTKPLLVMQMQHQVPGEEKEILKYFEDNFGKKHQDLFQKKHIDFELNMVENKAGQYPDTSIYFFANCNDNNRLSKVLEHFSKEIKAFCILNVYYKGDRKQNPQSVETVLNKVKSIPLKNDRIHHTLFLGKAKNFKYLKQTLENQVDCIDYFRLRFKRFPDTPISDLTKNIKNSDFTERSTPSLGIFILNNVKAVFELLHQIEQYSLNSQNDISIMELNSTVDLEYSASSSYLQDSILQEKMLTSQLEESKMSFLQEKPSMNNTTTKPLYNNENLNKDFFELEEAEEEGATEVEETSLEFSRLKSQLQRGYKQIQINAIGRLFSADNWKKYETQRNQHLKNGSEYVLFYNTNEDLDIDTITNQSLKEMQSHFIDLYNPNKHECPIVDGFKEMLAFLVLVDKYDQKLLACYPLYIITFV